MLTIFYSPSLNAFKDSMNLASLLGSMVLGVSKLFTSTSPNIPFLMLCIWSICSFYVLFLVSWMKLWKIPKLDKMRWKWAIILHRSDRSSAIFMEIYRLNLKIKLSYSVYSRVHRWMEEILYISWSVCAIRLCYRICYNRHRRMLSRMSGRWRETLSPNRPPYHYYLHSVWIWMNFNEV